MILDKDSYSIVLQYSADFGNDDLYSFVADLFKSMYRDMIICTDIKTRNIIMEYNGIKYECVRPNRRKYNMTIETFNDEIKSAIFDILYDIYFYKYVYRYNMKNFLFDHGECNNNYKINNKLLNKWYNLLKSKRFLDNIIYKFGIERCFSNNDFSNFRSIVNYHFIQKIASV
jgi:hypothetical protein